MNINEQKENLNWSGIMKKSKVLQFEIYDHVSHIYNTWTVNPDGSDIKCYYKSGVRTYGHISRFKRKTVLNAFKKAQRKYKLERYYDR